MCWLAQTSFVFRCIVVSHPDRETRFSAFLLTRHTPKHNPSTKMNSAVAHSCGTTPKHLCTLLVFVIVFNYMPDVFGTPMCRLSRGIKTKHRHYKTTATDTLSFSQRYSARRMPDTQNAASWPEIWRQIRCFAPFVRQVIYYQLSRIIMKSPGVGAATRRKTCSPRTRK